MPSTGGKKLIAIREKDLQEQKLSLEKAFEQWKGNQEQVDDVAIMGIRV